jgi:hypothetical protein
MLYQLSYASMRVYPSHNFSVSTPNKHNSADDYAAISKKVRGIKDKNERLA